MDNCTTALDCFFLWKHSVNVWLPNIFQNFITILKHTFFLKIKRDGKKYSICEKRYEKQFLFSKIRHAFTNNYFMSYLYNAFVCVII